MSESPEHPPARLRHWQRATVVAAGIALGLGVAVVVLVRREPPALDAAGAAVAAFLDDEARERAIERMVAENAGLWDSFADPDVGRVLQPRMSRFGVAANELGLRERAFELDKPAGVTRIVLLGDSYVYGLGVADDERVGSHLEKRLRSALDPDTAVECLHFGLVGWNIRAECAYLRRLLDLVRPDLVFHVVVANDLDDVAGARGFGAMAEGFSPQRPDRPSGALSSEYPERVLRASNRGWLAEGLDWESRTRFAEAADDLARLAAAVEARGGRYRLVNYWDLRKMAVAHERLFVKLRPDQLLNLSSPEFRDESLVISESDRHWNDAGCQRVAEFLHGAILERGLLPDLPLPADPAASATFLRIQQSGDRVRDRRRAEEKLTIGSDLEVGRWDAEQRRQVHGGVDAGGLVAPYASIILARSGGERLELLARALPRPELDGATVDVYADEERIATLTLRPGERLPVSQRLPEPVLERDYFSLRFIASDYVYDPADLQHCVSLQLVRARVH